MLMKSPAAPAKPPTFAHSGGWDVRLAAGIHCTCGRELRASDVAVGTAAGGDSDVVRMICGCGHSDVLIVEAPQ